MLTTFPNSLLPKSDATHMFDLLTDVAQCIRNEPRRLDQGDWLRKQHWDNAPECGVVGCTAGWMVVLTHGPVALDKHIRGVATCMFLAPGEYIFGNSRHPDGAFDEAIDALFSNYPNRDNGKAAYVQDVIAHILEFRDTWAARLLATPIHPPTLSLE